MFPVLGLFGPANTIPLPPATAPPSPSTLVAWFDGQDMDGLGNTTIPWGSTVTTAVNKGTAGGAFATVGTAQKSDLEQKFYSLLCAGNGGLAVSFPALTPPLTVAVLVKRTTTAAQYFCDGVASGHRAAILNNGAVINIQSFDALASGADTISQWNVIIGRFRTTAGANSAINLNFPEGTDSVTGALTTQTLTGLTVGCALDGTTGTVGKFAEGMVWSGEPTTQSIIDYFSTKYCAGWPKIKMVRRYPLTYVATSNVSMVGGEHWAVFGDSITATSLWQNTLAGLVNAVVTTPVVFVNNGVGGNRIADLLARTSDVTGQVPLPNGVIWEVGINDYAGVGGSGTATDISAFIDTYQQAINVIKAAGIAKHVFVGPLARGERTPDPVQVPLEQYNYAANYIAYVNRGAFVDVYTPKNAYEAINNLPAPGNLFDPGPLGQPLLTVDSTHPTTQGKNLMANAAMAKLTLSG